MAIPESQLNTWSNQGSTDGSAMTHKSIRNALSKHPWPREVDYDAYLQGSYANYTNIRGNSDVDLVVELKSAFSSNLSEAEQQQLGIKDASYGFPQFRDDVEKALTSYYGTDSVDASGQKSIKITASSNRLAADVVPCITYRNYQNSRRIARGITFWTRSSGEQIINFPKLHKRNGSVKNQKTGNCFKPSIRMFKNAREKILDNDPSLQGRYPSYFIECFLYNVPSKHFNGSYRDTYSGVCGSLASMSPDFSQFRCQNEQQQLFGEESTQWDIEEAVDFVRQLCILWEQWQ